MTIMERRRALMTMVGGVTENFVRIGNPTIVDGIMTPSEDSWIQLPNAFSPTVDDTWELVFKVIRTGATDFQNLLRSEGIMLQAPPRQSQPRIYIKSSGSTTWNIADGNFTATVSLNQWTWIKILYDGTQYEVLTSIDGVTFTHNHYFYRKLAIPVSTLLLGVKTSNTGPVQGQYDLNEAYIKLNDQYWWRAYT